MMTRRIIVDDRGEKSGMVVKGVEEEDDEE